MAHKWGTDSIIWYANMINNSVFEKCLAVLSLQKAINEAPCIMALVIRSLSEIFYYYYLFKP